MEMQTAAERAPNLTPARTLIRQMKRWVTFAYGKDARVIEEQHQVDGRMAGLLLDGRIVFYPPNG